MTVRDQDRCPAGQAVDMEGSGGGMGGARPIILKTSRPRLLARSGQQPQQTQGRLGAQSSWREGYPGFGLLSHRLPLEFPKHGAVCGGLKC